MLLIAILHLTFLIFHFCEYSSIFIFYVHTTYVHMCLIFKAPQIKANINGKKASIGQLPVTSSSGYKGRNRSTSTFSTASSASACYTFHHLNPDHENGGDGSDLPMVCQTSKSQPCSHHPSFSGPSGSR